MKERTSSSAVPRERDFKGAAAGFLGWSDKFWSRRRLHGLMLFPACAALFLPLLLSGCALFYGSDRSKAPAVAVSASPVARGGRQRLNVDSNRSERNANYTHRLRRKHVHAARNRRRSISNSEKHHQVHRDCHRETRHRNRHRDGRCFHRRHQFHQSRRVSHAGESHSRQLLRNAEPYGKRTDGTSAMTASTTTKWMASMTSSPPSPIRPMKAPPSSHSNSRAHASTTRRLTGWRVSET